MELLKSTKWTFIVLAEIHTGYSENMINAYPNKIINIHHSFLPAFRRCQTYHAAFESEYWCNQPLCYYGIIDARTVIEQDVVPFAVEEATQ